jgi:hypothetical protein
MIKVLWQPPYFLLTSLKINLRFSWVPQVWKLAWNLDLQVPRKNEPLSIWTSAKVAWSFLLGFEQKLCWYRRRVYLFAVKNWVTSLPIEVIFGGCIVITWNSLREHFCSALPSLTLALLLSSCRLRTWSPWPSLWHAACTRGQSVLHDLLFIQWTFWSQTDVKL